MTKDKNSDFNEYLDLSFDELLNVKVEVASNVATKITQQPSSVTVITGRQLRLSGARTLSEAITMFVPGYFKVEDQDDSIAGFRGLVPDNNVKVMLLINGQNMNTEYFWGPPPAILDTISYDWIERVEVIRGPGSVTLGQGALLGVINIVTKRGADLDKNGISTRIGAKWGLDQYLNTEADALFKQNDLSGFFHLSYSDHDGRKMRNDGYTRDRNNEGVAGGKLYNRGLHLNRAENVTSVGNVAYKGFEFTLFYTDQQKDLYNFYRDRDKVEERLVSLSLSYTHKFTGKLSLKVSGSYIRDDYYLLSTIGLTSGGTAENRWGLKAVLKADDFILSGNSIAFGYEFRRFELGRKNSRGDNFIINKYDAATLSGLPTANYDRTLVYKDEIHVNSLFFEDFYAINSMFTAFAAARFDYHTYWGYAITPRVGTLISPIADLRLRLSYQSGFRGAPGVVYSGGYRNDGFLSARNYDQVAAATGQPNIPAIKPETMHSFEFEASWDFMRQFNANLVWFYNIIRQASDVSVIQPGPPSIGSDIIGDWGGYWFYKNTPGDIHETGLEPALTFVNRYVTVKLSHAWVYLVRITTDSLHGSMYVTKGKTFRAYPDNVTRLNIMATPISALTLSLNYLYYGIWTSPNDNRIRGNHILNAGIAYEVIRGLEITFVAKNLLYHLYHQNLYPMNSVAGPATAKDLSDGSPALERTTFWLGLAYTF